MLRFHHSTIDSTSTRAAALAAEHPEAPLLVSAEAQTTGRGRTGRTWRSPVGGAWFSVAFPAPVSPMQTEAAPLLAGLAIAEALREWVDDARRLRIKWPNDVLLDGRKVAGILCERTLRDAAGHTLIIGVGINVNVAPTALGPDLRHPATSLAHALGREIDVRRVIDACAARLAEALAGLVDRGFTEADADRVNDRLAWRGEAVRLCQGESTIEGVALGVDRRGRLTLDVGQVSAVFHAGEVEQVRRVSEPLAGAPCA